ncbi:hypothetical protein SAMN04487928_12524 [Butyrivibrio proteoclasticus]|uniref:Uncharacterized protein n=1 Tax=Butyrivibrio proteoclasticus TaxID=43305 RepID=A0A1I5WUE1_9FIRM|nr:hypothetical protein SAMN04487928_12524 [Butyrivibrio proteoclasticus]
MKVEYELQVSGVGYPIEYVREGISYPLMLYSGGYCLAVMAISAALSHGYPVTSWHSLIQQSEFYRHL